jgi:hypothetical protein
VDLSRGVMRTLLEGNAEVSYYRPRYSPDGLRIAAGIMENGRWRVVVADRDGRIMRAVDPDDGHNRYDAEWFGNDSLVVVSEAGGIANLELLDIASGSATPLTRVTGAALAPAVHPTDRSIWFLSLHARGLDVRSLAPGTARPDSVVEISSARFGFAGMDRGTPRFLEADSVPPSRPYGLGPRHDRWLPGGSYSADGASAFVTLFSGDIVGRLNATVTGAYGQRGTSQGGSLRVSWRRPRPALELGVHGFLHEPSFGRNGQPEADSLDAAVSQNVLAAGHSRVGDGWSVTARLGGSAGSISPQRGGGSHFRGLGFGEVALSLLQSRGGRGVVERVGVHATQGHTRSTYQRVVGVLEVGTTGADMFPLLLRGVFGRMAGNPHPFERFVVGGAAAPLGDSSAMSQRFAMPVLPTGMATGSVLAAFRVAIPSPGWTLYYDGASASDKLWGARAWHRAVGSELAFDIPPVPVAFTPRVRARVGAAYTLDEPFRRRLRGYLEMRVEP